MKIAVLPGDGIGKEVTAQAVNVLKALKKDIQFTEAPIGGAGLEAAGVPLPPPALEDRDGAARIERAVRSALAQGYRTADMAQAGAKRVGCREMVTAVVCQPAKRGVRELLFADEVALTDLHWVNTNLRG